MKNLTLELNAANILSLDYDLRAALGSRFYGLTYDGSHVTLVLDDTVTPDQVRQAQTVVLTHDPARLTPDQQAAVLNAAKLDQARKDYAAAELDLTPYQGKDPTLEKLAQKVLWLEREINALRKTS